MAKSKKKDQGKKIIRVKSNPRVEEIVTSYPLTLTAYPRASFEEQLRIHLLKHKIK